MNSYPRETKEFIPVVVTVDGDPVTDYEVAVSMYGERPESWEAPVALDTEQGILIDALDPGYWSIWARVTDSPEVPVILVDTIAVT